MNLKDKVTIVTGSSRGLGKAIALSFAREGCNLVVNYNKSKDEAEKIVRNITSMGCRAIAVQADVSDEKQVVKMVDTAINHFKKIDILVNNAGIHIDSTVWKMDQEMWDKVIKINLNGVFYCTKHVVKHMRETRCGKIVNISSVVGQTGGFGTANYSASKAGVIGFTKTIAKEVALRGITVNCVALGYIDIGMGSDLPQDMKDHLVKQIPIGRFGKPEEVTQTVLFLASEGANYITGQVININGGCYL